MIVQQVIRYENAPAIEVTWVNEDGVIVRCHAYGNTQMDELRADLGADAAQYEAMIAEVEATQEPPLPPPVPATCTPAQGLVALYVVKGITEQHLMAAIDQIPDPTQRYTAKIGMTRATEWSRYSATVLALRGLLKLTDQDLDDLFTHAVTVAV